MNLIWRIILTYIFARFEKTQGILEPSYLKLRVLPTDADFLWHLNNGRYLSLLDLARIKYLITTNSLKKIKRLGVYPVVASETIRFKKSIDMFKQFEIKTQLVGWDDKFFYIHHTLYCNNELCAMAGIKVCYIKKRQGLVNTHDIVDALGLPAVSPVLPTWVIEWNTADQALYESSIMQNV